MKRITTNLLLLFILPFSLRAQFLADNRSASHTASGITANGEIPAWSKEEDRINGRIATKQLSKMRTVTDSIITFFQTSCMSEAQYNLSWHGEYSSEKISGAAQMKFGAACNIGDAKASLQIMANDLSPLMEPMTLNNQEYMAMVPTRSMQKDCPYFEIEGQDGYAPSRFWLITNDNQQLPYTIVSRKEFLEQGRAQLQGMKNEILAELSQKMPIRSREAQEAEKKVAIDQMNNSYSGADLQMRMRMFLRDYHTDEEYFKENADKATAGLDDAIHLMDSLRTKLPADELKRPATVSGPVASFTGFSENGQDRLLVKSNAAYYSPYLSSEKPQLFLVSWTYDASEQQVKELDHQLRERFNASYLRSMLGK